MVVLNTGSPVAMPWADKANAIIQTWFAGQEFGNALVDIMTGDINPSGKLPTTFPKNIEDTPAFKTYPGKDLQMDYEEKLLVGYKWYEVKNIEPLFHFGHGLSYTQFEYKDLKTEIHNTHEVSCKFSIKNTGNFSGAEPAQCYVGFMQREDDEPMKTLQGFNKMNIDPGKEVEIEITLNSRSFSSWSTQKEGWEIKQGTYQIMIGDSSDNILLQTEIIL